MYCNNCGYQMPDGSEYCDSCGSKMFQPPTGEEAVAAAAEIAAASQPPPPTYSNPFAAPQAQPYGQQPFYGNAAQPTSPPQAQLPGPPAFYGYTQQPYGQYGQQPYYGNPAQPTKTNTMAIVGLVLSLVCFGGLPSLICSIVGLSQCRQRNEKGSGLAIAGIIISIVMMIFSMIAVFSGVLDTVLEGM